MSTIFSQEDYNNAREFVRVFKNYDKIATIPPGIASIYVKVTNRLLSIAKELIEEGKKPLDFYYIDSKLDIGSGEVEVKGSLFEIPQCNNLTELCSWFSISDYSIKSSSIARSYNKAIVVFKSMFNGDYDNYCIGVVFATIHAFIQKRKTPLTPCLLPLYILKAESGPYGKIFKLGVEYKNEFFYLPAEDLMNSILGIEISEATKTSIILSIKKEISIITPIFITVEQLPVSEKGRKYLDYFISSIPSKRKSDKERTEINERNLNLLKDFITSLFKQNLILHSYLELNPYASLETVSDKNGSIGLVYTRELITNKSISYSQFVPISINVEGRTFQIKLIAERINITIEHWSLYTNRVIYSLFIDLDKLTIENWL